MELETAYYARSPLTGLYLGEEEIFDETYDSAKPFATTKELTDKLCLLAGVGGFPVSAEIVTVITAVVDIGYSG